MTTQPNINGVTLEQITGMMRREEKRIAYYNQKSQFGAVPLTADEQRLYDSAQHNWDFMKQQRDYLKRLS